MPSFSVYAYVYERGQLRKGLHTVSIPSDADALELQTLFADILGLKFENIVMWKPRKSIKVGGLKTLSELLRKHKNRLSGFCDQVLELPGVADEDIDIATLLGIEPEARGVTQPCLVAQVVIYSYPPKSNSPLVLPEDVLGEMHEEFKRNINRDDRKSPSVSCQSTNYQAEQGGQHPILDGRYAHKPNTVPLPIEIYHSAFAAFAAESRDPNLAVPDDFVQKISQLMLFVSQISVLESPRQERTREKLQELLGFAVTPLRSASGSAPDHGIVSTQPGMIGSAALAIVEEKSELGSGNDPVVQGSFSYLAHWSDNGQKKLVEACFAPSFIIGLAGPHISICGAIFLASTIVQRLTDYVWMAHSRQIDDSNTLRVARILWALRMALERLKSYYAQVTQPETDKMRYFSLATEYKGGDGRTVKFEYVDFLKSPGDSCNTFLARQCDDQARMIVVKFVERYGETAHRLLAANKLAPALLYYGDIWLSGPEQHGCGPRKMVVMEYVSGQVAADWVDSASDSDMISVWKAMQQALELLQSQTPPLVHGDLRLLNIHIADVQDGVDEGVQKRVRLLDFDWAGEAGVTRYPFHLSQQIKWPSGAKAYAYITTAHDDEMVARLEPKP